MPALCPTCGTELAAERAATFCPNCGSALSAGIEESRPVVCEACGRELFAEAKFCDGCGHPTAVTTFIPPVPPPVSSPQMATLAQPQPAAEKRGLAGVVRTGPWWARVLALVPVPFWATSEIRQASWSKGAKWTAAGAVWMLTITAAAASPAGRVPEVIESPEAIETADPSTPPPSPTATSTPFDNGPQGWPRPPSDAQEAFVASVTDGDTIVLRGINFGEVHAATGGRKTRLIGVDTPEVFGGVECYGASASAFTKEQLENRTVLVTFDVERIDRFGRALAYVWNADGVFFNAKLAFEGYAQQLTVPPNVRYVELFSQLVREARENNRGLWGGCIESGPGADQPPQAQSADRDCPDFATHQEAQAFYEQQGGPGRDPHRLDSDNDGLACEALPGGPASGSSGGSRAAPAPQTDPPSGGSGCHPSYPDFCIAPPPPDLNCPEVNGSNFTVRHDVANADPHGFDRDNDGIGCES